MNKNPIYNFVILGKSGTGKSSLINHFFNQEIAKVGQGKPVTGKEFEKFKLKEANLEINIYDSWGIEGGKTNEWTSYLKEFIDSRKRENISDWIHTAVYCIAAESKRLEDFERDIINQLVKEELNPIIVIAKSDLDSEQIFLKSIIREYPKLSVVAICNVEKQIGLGIKKTVSSQFGIKELKEEVLKSSIKSFEKRFIHIAEEIINNSKKNAVVYFDKEVDRILNGYKTNLIGNISANVLENIEKDIVDNINFYNRKTSDKIINMYNQAVQIYGEFSSSKLPSLGIYGENFRIDEEDSFLRKFILSMNGGNPKFRTPTSTISTMSIITVLFPMIALPTLIFINSGKFYGFLKGIDKQNLKNTIMLKIKEYYS